MREVFRETLDEAAKEVNEWVEIFQQNDIHLEILGIKVVPDHICEENEDEEYNCSDEEEEDDDKFFMSKLRNGGYYDFEQLCCDSLSSEDYGAREDYVWSLSSLGVMPRLSAIEKWANLLTNIEVDWKLHADGIPYDEMGIPDTEEDLCQIIDDYKSNLDEEYLDAIRRKIKSKISQWEWYLDRID